MTKPIAFVIEDDLALNRIFSVALENNFDVHSCTSGDDAFTELESSLPVLVILDLNLVGASGADILKYIRANERFAHTRVLLATADERQAETLERDADLVLLKPISPMQLRELSSRFTAPK